MKKFLILFLICFTQHILSQNNESKKTPDDLKDNLNNYTKEEVIFNDDKIYNAAGLEILPAFPGGYDAFQKFLISNFTPPQEKPNIKGKIYTTFIVEKDGSLNDIKVLRDLGYNTGDEAIRVLKSSPKWSPGKQNNKVVRVLFSAPILVNIPVK